MKKHRLVITIILCAAAIILLPKGIDLLYCNSQKSILSLNYLDAKDIITYAGSVIGGLLGLVAVAVAVFQFRRANGVIIVPHNIRIDYYPVHDVFEQRFMSGEVIKDAIRGITLENITDNAALTYSFEVNFANGEWFSNYMESITNQPIEDKYHDFTTKTFVNRGTLAAHSSTIVRFEELHMIERILKELSIELCMPKDGKRRFCPYVGKQYKLMEITINAADKFGYTVSNVFEMNAVVNVISSVVPQTDIILEFTQLVK